MMFSLPWLAFQLREQISLLLIEAGFSESWRALAFEYAWHIALESKANPISAATRAMMDGLSVEVGCWIVGAVCGSQAQVLSQNLARLLQRSCLDPQAIEWRELDCAHDALVLVGQLNSLPRMSATTWMLS